MFAMPWASPIIAAKLRLSTIFAIMVSFDVKEASVYPSGQRLAGSLPSRASWPEG
jgi:hypothetical protein